MIPMASLTTTGGRFLFLFILLFLGLSFSSTLLSISTFFRFSTFLFSISTPFLFSSSGCYRGAAFSRVVPFDTSPCPQSGLQNGGTYSTLAAFSLVQFDSFFTAFSSCAYCRLVGLNPMLSAAHCSKVSFKDAIVFAGFNLGKCVIVLFITFLE